MYNADRIPVASFHKVEPGVYNMGKIDQPLLLTPLGTIAFQGYDVVENSVQENESDLPSMERDVLQEKRHLAFHSLKEDSVSGTVSRKNIIKSLIHFYTSAHAD